jgi:hypothetical protein
VIRRGLRGPGLQALADGGYICRKSLFMFEVERGLIGWAA